MEKYKLPKEWYIKITDDNKKIVNDWKIKQEWDEDLYKSTSNYRTVTNTGSGGWRDTDPRGAIEITTDQFIQYVLKQDVFPKNWAIRQNACQEACDWLNDNYPEYVKIHGKADKIGGGYAYITFKGEYIFNFADLGNHIEITKEQFIKYVLKFQKPNYSKLINILKFIDGSSRM